MQISLYESKYSNMQPVSRDIKYPPTWTLQFNTCWEQTGCQVAVQYSDVILFQTTPKVSSEKFIANYYE